MAHSSDAVDAALFRLVRYDLMDVLRIKRLPPAEAHFVKEGHGTLPTCGNNGDGRITCFYRFNRKLGGAGATTLAQCFLQVRPLGAAAHAHAIVQNASDELCAEVLKSRRHRFTHCRARRPLCWLRGTSYISGQPCFSTPTPPARTRARRYSICVW